MKELIPLQHCHITQQTSGNTKSEWLIQQNKTEDNLGSLPKQLNEKEVFSIIAFSRKFELNALNVGIAFGKKKQKETQDKIQRDLLNKIMIAKKENERLATALDRLTRK